jgi:uncharacterized protein DUF3179
MVASCLAALIVTSGCRQRPAPNAVAAAPAGAKISSTAAANHRFPTIMMDVRAINPKLVPAAETNLDDKQIVIGVEIDGEARAYLRDAFDDPQKHLVCDKVADVPIAVTHCDRSRCTRVFTQEDPSLPIDIRNGGWRSDDTMELVVNGTRYSQKADNVPLKSLPFVEMTWEQWRRLYPDSLIYVGQQLMN